MKNNISLKFLLFLLCALILTSKSYAQPLSSEEIRELIIKDWERGKAFTVDYLNAMPADKYSFRPVDSIRNFAQQMLHLALSNVFLMSNATDKQPLSYLQSDFEHSPTAQKKAIVFFCRNQACLYDERF